VAKEKSLLLGMAQEGDQAAAAEAGEKEFSTGRDRLQAAVEALWA
jgi:hypothetical protein